MDRADFYVGIKRQYWIGSLLKYGSPYHIPFEIMMEINDTSFVETLNGFLEYHKFGIPQSEGWPHLWADSQMTDYAYYFEDGKLYFSMMEEDFHKTLFDTRMVAILGELEKYKEGVKEKPFPKMRLLASIHG